MELLAKALVLIETSWNVKNDEDSWLSFQGTVLIETSWNVKVFCPYGKHKRNIVLIETSWNVKYVRRITLSPNAGY